MFKGTETMFNNSIEQLRAEVAAIQNGSRAYEDELLDTPMDTWTSQDNETVQSHWICYDFNTVEEYEACYDWVCENGVKNASFRRCEIMNI
jgi:hypothetical protein